MIEQTGFTQEGDAIVEWQDTSVSPAQHQVYLDREHRGLPDIVFSFPSQEDAHALFAALCKATRVFVESDTRENKSL